MKKSLKRSMNKNIPRIADCGCDEDSREDADQFNCVSINYNIQSV